MVVEGLASGLESELCKCVERLWVIMLSLSHSLIDGRSIWAQVFDRRSQDHLALQCLDFFVYFFERWSISGLRQRFSKCSFMKGIFLR